MEHQCAPTIVDKEFVDGVASVFHSYHTKSVVVAIAVRCNHIGEDKALVAAQLAYGYKEREVVDAVASIRGGVDDGLFVDFGVKTVFTVKVVGQVFTECCVGDVEAIGGVYRQMEYQKAVARISVGRAEWVVSSGDELLSEHDVRLVVADGLIDGDGVVVIYGKPQSDNAIAANRVGQGVLVESR